MKKSILKWSVAVFCMLLLAGCGTSYYPMNNYNVAHTQVVLSQNNFHVVGMAQGETMAWYVCGIGGLSKKAAKEMAVAEMFENANLTGSQTIVNISVKSHVKTFLVYTEHYYVATGTIIEFE